MTWDQELIALWKAAGDHYKTEELPLRISKGRAYIAEANRVLPQQAPDDPALPLETGRRNVECMDIANKLREQGDIAGALQEILALATYPMPNMQLVDFYGAAFQAGSGDFAASAQSRLAYLYVISLDDKPAWSGVYQINQRSKLVTEDFAAALAHTPPADKLAMATAHFCHALSLGQQAVSKTKVIEEFRTALFAAPDNPPIIAAVQAIETHYLRNQKPLYPTSPELRTDQEYCSLTVEGMDEQRWAQIEFYGRNQSPRREALDVNDLKTIQEKLTADGWKLYANFHTGRDQHSTLFYVRPKA